MMPMMPPTTTVDSASVTRLSGPFGHLWFSVSAPKHFGHVAIFSRILTHGVVANRAYPRVDALVAGRVGLVSDLFPVPPRVCTERMRERRRTVRAAVRNVVRELPLLGIEVREMADALRDLVIGACGIAAHAETA